MGYEVTLLCTGKGKHAPMKFGPILDQRDRVELIGMLTPHAEAPPTTGHRRERRKRTAASGAEIVSLSTSVRIVANKKGARAFYVGPCPLCPCNPRVAESTMLLLLDSIYAAPDTPELFDISYWRI